MNRLNTLILVILSIIILGILFYIYNLHTRINSLIESQTEEQVVFSPLQLNPGLDIDSLSMLTYWQEGIIKSADVTAKLEGKIVEIDTNGVVEEHGWPTFKYALKIRIRGNNGDENDIFISPVELQSTSFQTVNKNDISYKDLKINDNIRALVSFDLTKKFMSNYVSGQIIKL